MTLTAADVFKEGERLIQRAATMRVSGRLVEVTGLTLVAEELNLPVGSICVVEPRAADPTLAQVVGLRAGQSVLMTLGDSGGMARGDRVTSRCGLDAVPVGRQMLGAVLDGLGRPVGGKTDYLVESRYPTLSAPPQALSRSPIEKPLPTGIRAIDAMLTIGGGQRLGIFAGTGVGKSVLLGMIARYTQADVIVVALVGERGREVGDFIRKDLGEEGMRRCVLVASTSDESPVLRVRAGFVATAVAEYFRDIGKDVLLLMDSTTRIAMAQRQIGLAAGEPPATKGYPPSAFAMLPQLLERSGKTNHGSITGLYTVLVEGDDVSEPVSDSIRGVLDGHVWLSRELANRGQYPAVSVLESISRLMVDVVDQRHQGAAANVRRVLSVWNDIEDLVNVGAYAPGANSEFDLAVRLKPAIEEFLAQRIEENAAFQDTCEALVELSDRIDQERARLTGSKTKAGGAPARTERSAAPVG